MKSKKFTYTYEDTEEKNKGVKTMIPEILADPEFPGLEEVVIGCWGECWDDDAGAQPLIDAIVEHKDAFSHIKSLFIGDMDYEDCEVSWIEQGDYSKLWEAMPQLERLTIKGSTNLSLGAVAHDTLRELTVICGGLPASVLKEIQGAKLPKLEKLLLYLGVDDYGFDGDITTIRSLLSQSDFPQLTYLGLTDSSIQDEVAEEVLQSKYIDQLTVLDLSNGSLSDKGGRLLLEQIPKHANIKELILEYHYLSDDMMEKLAGLSGVTVNVEDPQEPDEYNGTVYCYPMLTE